jgi:hypothetical protein
LSKPCSDFWESPEPGHCFQQGLAGIESVEPITLSVTARHAPSDAARASVKSESSTKGSIKDSIKVRAYSCLPRGAAHALTLKFAHCRARTFHKMMTRKRRPAL